MGGHVRIVDGMCPRSTRERCAKLETVPGKLHTHVAPEWALWVSQEPYGRYRAPAHLRQAVASIVVEL